MDESNSIFNISLPSALSAISSALDSIHPALQSHQKRTCVIACHIAKKLNFSQNQLHDVFDASIIHDLGALGTQNRIALLSFEEVNPDLHAAMGAALIAKSEVFRHLSPAIKFHHKPWLNGENLIIDGEDVPLLAHLIHLSDRIEVLCHEPNLLSSADSIRTTIASKSGKVFHPELVKAF